MPALYGADGTLTTIGNLQSLGSNMLSTYSTAAIAGVAVHHLVFKKGEWHMYAPGLVKLYFSGCAFVALLHAISSPTGTPLYSSLWSSLFFIAAFSFSLFISIAVYRVFFHRIRHFPGPPLASVTKLWHSVKCVRAKNYRILKNMHDQYGDFVRTGPSEVTIFHPEGLTKLDGPGNKCMKSDWYDYIRPHFGVTTIRDKPFHDQRRRIWTKGMSTNAMATYEGHIASEAQKLEAIVGSHADKGQPIDFTTHSYWFSFDVMGLFVFSRSFDMLSKREWHYGVTTLRRAMALLGPFSAVPWLGQIGFRFLRNYWVVKDWFTMIKFCEERMYEHIKSEKDTTDVANWLIDDSKKRNSLEQDHHLLTGDAIVAIIAGSDTVAPTMVFIFYQLALHPEHQEKLYQELQDIDVFNLQALRHLQHLDAVIKETLRYFPVIPTGGYRDSPPEGMTVGGTYIPGNITIVAPRYVLCRLESCYVDANKWIPERWTRFPEMVKDDRPNLPFGQGRYTCLGKDLAMTELRLITALLVSRYHIKVAPGTDPSAVERDMTDQFTATAGELKLVFERR